MSDCPSCREPLDYPSGDGCAAMTKHKEKPMSDATVTITASTFEYMADRIENLETLIKDFFILLDKTEETDDGRVFRPNRISSCRAEDGQKLENLLRLMKATVEGRW